MSDPETCHIQPGQLVECIDDEWYGEDELPPRLPMSGCIYAVARVIEYRGGFYLQLDPFGAEYVYRSLHFRPVQTPDISVFRRLLAPTPALAKTREAELA